jgi:hypothetical protein
MARLQLFRNFVLSNIYPDPKEKWPAACQLMTVVRGKPAPVFEFLNMKAGRRKTPEKGA